MLVLLLVLTGGCIARVFWLRWSEEWQRASEELPALPEQDLPPAAALGWPPQGEAFTAYVDDGFAALDAYLEEGFAP
jgi:hypothetical protein